MPKIKPFEKYSDAYDDWFEKNHDLYESELKAIRRLLPSSSANRLEVGVGSGKFAAPLGIQFGVDPSEKMARKARELGIHVCLGVAEDLPFPDGSFECALMVTTICFVDDIKKSFREVRRILRSCGFIVVGFVDRNSALGQKYLSKSKESKFYNEATFFSTQEVLNFLEKAGFGSVQIKQTLIPGESKDSILEGYGKGAFVAIKAEKRTGSR